MSTGLLLQYIVVVLIVLVSAWVVLKKQFPGTVRKARGAIALPASGSGGACGGCDSCGPSTPKQH